MKKSLILLTTMFFFVSVFSAVGFAADKKVSEITIGITGFNPYRISQFENIDLWIKAGMSRQAAEDYLGAIKASLNSPNMVLDLRIPQNQRYQQIVLDTAIARMLAGEITKAQAMKAIEAGWEEITEELGREEQLKAYRATLGR